MKKFSEAEQQRAFAQLEVLEKSLNYKIGFQSVYDRPAINRKAEVQVQCELNLALDLLARAFEHALSDELEDAIDEFIERHKKLEPVKETP